MITTDHMVLELLAACPEFEPAWRAFLEEWREEPVEPPVYLALADFARQIVSLLERRQDETLRKIFHVIERLHVEGDSFVKEAAVIGILESLLDCPDLERLTAFMQPETRRWWEKLQRFWQGDARALRD